MTPAERLLAAADLLDKRAGEAAPDWRLDSDNHLGLLSVATPYTVGPDLWVAAKNKAGERYMFTGPDDKTTHYIATMHPEVGKALAALLRLETRYDIPPNPYALTLADLLLAGAS